ncbi:hypothetical protein JYU34_004556 [Plutella xylostella]|uniref:Uncharacterized protein n=1 Tax=Plutella xylostella TaxID=51655 RepID=A0ABQ7QY96_PLUXY|nr:hypothetical protein JYU34_004556 [Plutella xylostella]
MSTCRANLKRRRVVKQQYVCRRAACRGRQEEASVSGDVRSVNTCFNQACCSVSVAAAPICAKKNFAYDFITRPTDADCGRAPGLNFERPCRLSFNCFIVCQQTINKEPFYAISNSCTIYVFCQQTGIGCNELSSGRSWYRYTHWFVYSGYPNASNLSAIMEARGVPASTRLKPLHT